MSDISAYTNPEAVAVKQYAEMLQGKYAGMKVATRSEYVMATDFLKDIKAQTKRLDDLRRSMTKPLDDSKAKIMNFFRGPAEALLAAEKSVKDAILRFQREQERAAALERIAARKAEEERAEEAIMAAAEAGDIDRVEELVGAPAPVLPMAMAPVVAKVDGLQTRTVWKWRLTDFTKVPRDYLKLDESMIGSVVRAKQGKITIPGIEVYSEDVIASGRM